MENSMKQTLGQALRLSPKQIALVSIFAENAQTLEQRIMQEVANNPALDYEETADENLPEAPNEEEATAAGIGGEESLEENLKADREEEAQAAEGEDAVSMNEPAEDSQERFDDIEWEDDDYIPDHRAKRDEDGNFADDGMVRIAGEESFSDDLLGQLAMLTDDERTRKIAGFIIGSLDERGYLAQPVPSIANSLSIMRDGVQTTAEEVEQVLTQVVQRLEPAGLGARSLQECLLLQLKRISPKDKYVEMATVVVERYFDALSKRHYDKLRSRLGCTEDELREVLDRITKLSPSVGHLVGNSMADKVRVMPDFEVYENDGKLKVESKKCRLRPKKADDFVALYKQISERKTDAKGDETTLEFMRNKLAEADWFISSIQQRESSLAELMKAIVSYQREFFLSGDKSRLRPWLMKDLAESLGKDSSIISRLVNSKYVQTPYGVFLLRDFFSESIEDKDGNELSMESVREIFDRIISNEDKAHPLTDEELQALLAKEGIEIARRTVAKYREQLGIPVSRLRKEL